MGVPLKVNRKQQQGVILVLALFVVVLVTSIAVAATWRFELNQIRNEHRWHGAMINTYGYSAENFALKMLEDDSPSYDCATADIEKKQDLWAAELPYMETAEGTIGLRVVDMNRKFNINLLNDLLPVTQVNGVITPIVPTTPSEYFTEAQRMFIRLLQTIELQGGYLSTQDAIVITDAVIDWIDADNNPHGSYGAEQQYYQGLPEPYTVPNRPMISISELALVKGVTPELYHKISPLLTALNSEQKLNLNTMLPQLERMFNYKERLEPFDERRLQQLREYPNTRKASGVQQVNKNKPNTQTQEAGCMQSLNESLENHLVLWDLTAGAGGNPSAQGTFDMQGFNRYVGVSSGYFAVYSEVRVGELVRTNKSLIKRTGQGKGASLVIRRTDGTL